MHTGWRNKPFGARTASREEQGSADTGTCARIRHPALHAHFLPVSACLRHSGADDGVEGVGHNVGHLGDVGSMRIAAEEDHLMRAAGKSREVALSLGRGLGSAMSKGVGFAGVANGVNTMFRL